MTDDTQTAPVRERPPKGRVTERIPAHLAQETFGPVAIVEAVPDTDAAIASANDTPWALAAGILTRNESNGLRLARRLTAGMVHVNDQPVNDQPHMPFGGSLYSGWGRFGTGPRGRSACTVVPVP